MSDFTGPLSNIYNILRSAEQPTDLPYANKMLEGMKEHEVDVRSHEIAQQILVTVQHMQNNPKVMPRGLQNMLASERDKELKKIKESVQKFVEHIPKKTPPPKIKSEESKT